MKNILVSFNSIKKIIIISLLIFFTFGSFNISNALNKNYKITKIMNNFYTKLQKSTPKVEKRIKKLIIIKNKINILKRKKIRQSRHNQVKLLAIINKSINEKIKELKLKPYNNILNNNEYNITVDFSDEVGEYKNLLGVNKAPLMKNRTGSLSIDISEAYEKIGVSEVRMHDEELDLCEIYGSKNITVSRIGSGILIPDSCKIQNSDARYISKWEIDSGVNNISRYDFSGVEEKIKLIKKSGAKLYLRLGESWGGPNDIETSGDSSGSIDDYSTVAKNIFKYYNGTLAGTEDPEIQISAVEIHNEGNSDRFWKGDTSLYHNIIKKSIEKIKDTTTSIPVGAAGFTQGVKGQLINPAKPIAYNFIENVGKENLDFLSVHYYGACSEATMSDFYSWIKDLNKNIATKGVQEIPIHITEWNIGTGNECGKESVNVYNTPHMFSYVAGMLLLFQKEELNIDHSLFYLGQGSKMGLFSLSRSGSLEPNKGLMAFYLYKGLNADKIVKTYVKKTDFLYGSSDIISGNIIAEGFKTNDGGYKVVIVNDNNTSKKINLNLKNIILSGKTATKTTYSISDEDYEFSYSPCEDGTSNKCIDTDDLDSYINSNISTSPLVFGYSPTSTAGSDKKTTFTIEANSAVVLNIE